MSEIQETQQAPTESKEEIKPVEDKGILEEAKAIKEIIEKEKEANLNLLEKIKEERIRYEKLIAEQLLQGRSRAGLAVEEDKETKAKREAMKLLEGTGLNPFR